MFAARTAEWYEPRGACYRTVIGSAKIISMRVYVLS